MRKLHILTLILKLNAHTYLQTYKILRTSYRSYLDLSKFKSKMSQNIYTPTIFYLVSFRFKCNNIIKYLNLYDWIVFQAGNDP